MAVRHGLHSGREEKILEESEGETFVEMVQMDIGRFTCPESSSALKDGRRESNKLLYTLL